MNTRTNRASATEPIAVSRRFNQRVPTYPPVDSVRYYQYHTRVSKKDSIRRVRILLLVGGLAATTLAVGLLTLRNQAQSRLSAVGEALDAQRNFQGLVLDGSGVGLLALNLFEGSSRYFVESIQCRFEGHQSFSADFRPARSALLPLLPPVHFSLRYEGATLSIVLRVLALPGTVATLLGSSLLTAAIGALALAWTRKNQRRKREWEKARLKAEVAEQVAHDIRSPLFALQLLAARAESQLPEEIRDTTRAAISRIQEILRDLSSAPRGLRADTATPSTRVDRCLEEIITEKRLQMSHPSQLVLERENTRVEENLSVPIAPADLKRALSNLIQNALEAISSPPTPSPEKQGDAKWVRVRVSGSDDCCRILIHDNGPGMSPEMLRELGNRGYTSGKSGGSGLGVFQAKQLLESTGGSIQFKSVPGAGTEVLLKLPQTGP